MVRHFRIQLGKFGCAFNFSEVDDRTPHGTTLHRTKRHPILTSSSLLSNQMRRAEIKRRRQLGIKSKNALCSDRATEHPMEEDAELECVASTNAGTSVGASTAMSRPLVLGR